jgi:hypothetical protein
MPRMPKHDEEFGRIGAMEHNVAIDATDLFGPSKRFEQKSQSSNPTSGGGINRPLRGTGKAKKDYSGSAQ